MLKRYLLASLTPLAIFAATLAPNPPVPITTDSSVNSSVVVAWNTSVYMAIWENNAGPNTLQFSTSSNNGTSWSEVTPYPNDNFPITGPWLTGSNSDFVVVWIDSTIGTAAGNLLASVTSDNGATWSMPTVVKSGADVIEATVYGTSSGFLAVWWQQDAGVNSVYSSFSTDGLSWGMPVLVSTDMSDYVSTMPIATGEGDNFMVAWTSNEGNVYASFSGNRGSSWLMSKSLVSTLSNNGLPATPLITSDGYLITFSDSSGTGYSSYSSTSGTTWDAAQTICTGLNGAEIPIIGIETVNGSMVVATFSDNSGQASLSTSDGTSWDSFVSFTASYPVLYANSNFVDIVQGTDGVMATWLDSSSDAISAFFPFGPLAPTNLSGISQINTFPFQRQYYAGLNWQPSSSTGVAGYNVYRDGTLVGETSANYYDDQTIKRGASYTYIVKAFDGSGNESGAATIVVTIP